MNLFVRQKLVNLGYPLETLAIYDSPSLEHSVEEKRIAVDNLWYVPVGNCLTAQMIIETHGLKPTELRAITDLVNPYRRPLTTIRPLGLLLTYPTTGELLKSFKVSGCCLDALELLLLENEDLIYALSPDDCVVMAQFFRNTDHPQYDLLNFLGRIVNHGGIKLVELARLISAIYTVHFRTTLKNYPGEGVANKRTSALSSRNSEFDGEQYDEKRAIGLDISEKEKPNAR